MKNTNEAKAIPERFTQTAADLLGKTTSKEESARKQAQAAYDQMISDGMLWTDFLPVKAKGSTATPELREALLAARRKGFGAWAPKLYKTPNTALSKEDIAKKNKLRTDVNKKITDDMKAMRLRHPEYRASKSTAKGKSGRAAQQPTGQAKAAGSAAKVLESLQQAAKRAQAIEEPEFDVVALVDLLAKAQQIVVKQ